MFPHHVITMIEQYLWQWSFKMLLRNKTCITNEVRHYAQIIRHGYQQIAESGPIYIRCRQIIAHEVLLAFGGLAIKHPG